MVRHRYRYRTLREVRYHIETATGHLGKFGSMPIPVQPEPIQTLIPVPDTSVSSVQHQYRYRTRWELRHDSHTGTENNSTVPNAPLQNLFRLRIGVELTSVLGSKSTWFLYRGRKLLVFSVGIEIGFSFVRGSKFFVFVLSGLEIHCYSVSTEIDMFFLWGRSKLT